MTNEEVIKAEKARARLLARFREWEQGTILSRRRIAGIAARFLGSVSQEAILKAETMLEERKHAE